MPWFFLKKDGLEPIFKNYRPVSNLQFISKLTESAVAKQLQHHINKNNLFPLLQSVVHMATLGPNQSERSKFRLDQSESRIWTMWLFDVTNQGFNPRDP